MMHRIALLLVGLGALAALAAPARWPFDPPRDAFSAAALLDLRYLNETSAGETGFIRVSPGGDFLRGDGQPIRFWAINTGVQGNSREHLPRHARFLAKRGVNMVRFHGFLQPKAPTSRITDFDTSQRDSCWQLVAEMKKEGIYTTISPYWANNCTVQSSWKIPGVTDGDAHALLFFEPALQKGYKAWLRALFAETNTYTGIPLAHDPAVAIIQLQNEDSLLFWTFDRISVTQKKVVRGMFFAWVTNKYGSISRARNVWRGEELPGDDAHQDTLDLYITWELTRPQTGGKALRIADQLQFLSELMYRFNAEMVAYLRDELGCKQVINAGNWRTADTYLLNDAERWSYTAAEVLAVNRYYNGGVHQGSKRGWAIDAGDTFSEQSVLLNPGELPINLKQVQGYPIIVTESSWVPPLGYQSEGPFLVAAYQSLTGVDGFYWFATGRTEWQPPESANGFVEAIGKWVCATPMLLGNFPAAALLYRMNYVQRGEPVIIEERPPLALWRRLPPLIAEERSYDPNRDTGDGAAKPAARQRVSPLSFLIGPVLVKYSGHPTNSFVAPMASFVDAKRKTVRSNTGELVMDCARGVCVVNAPKAQGASGFLNRAGQIILADTTIISSNEYATVLIVALDDQPLKNSTNILVQVGTQARPTGWEVDATEIKSDGGVTLQGFRVVDFGRAPWQIINTDVHLSIANPALTHAVALDANGMALTTMALTASNGVARVSLPPRTLYTVLR